MKQTRIIFGVIGLVILGMVVAFVARPDESTQTVQQTATEAQRTVSARQFSTLITTEPDRRVIDVRTESEYQAGHIPGAENIDFYNPAFVEQFAGLPLDMPLTLYCQSGNRSGQALRALTEAGFTDIVNLEGGIAAWQAMGGEVE